MNVFIGQHIQSPPAIYPFKQSSELLVRLLYTNFTGSGFLSLSLSQFGNIQFNLRVGKKTILSFKEMNKYKTLVEWKWITTPINSSQETVSLVYRNNVPVNGGVHRAPV
jgi:hypothetical protein